MINFINVQKKFFDNVVLNNISINFKQGEVVAILGSSGSGKSTMLRCINGLETISDGDILVNNLSVKKQDELKKIRLTCGMVFQQFNLFPHLTVIENITLSPIKVLGMGKSEAKDIATNLLDKVGLLPKMDFYPSQLSGGQQQRVAIARSLAMGPKVLLLDEVTSALDPEMTTEVMNIIETLANDGITLLVVTHEMGFAERTAKRVLFLEHGNISFDVPSNAFFKLEDERVKRFLSHAID